MLTQVHLSPSGIDGKQGSMKVSTPSSFAALAKLFSSEAPCGPSRSSLHKRGLGEGRSLSSCCVQRSQADGAAGQPQASRIALLGCCTWLAKGSSNSP